MEFSNFDVENISAFGKTSLDFSKFTFCQVKGRKNVDGVDNNGACKTGIFDVPTWVLYDNTAKGISKDLILREGTKQGYGEITVVDRKKVVTVRRERGKSNALTMFVDGVELTEKGQTQRKIIEAIGLDFQSFVSSAYFGQNELNSFCSGTNLKRTEIIEGIITDIKKLDELNTIMKSQLREITVELEAFRSDREAVKRLLENIDIKSLKKDESRLYTLIESYADKLAAVTYKMNGLQEKKTLVDKFNVVEASVIDYRAERYTRLKEYEGDLLKAKERVKGAKAIDYKGKKLALDAKIKKISKNIERYQQDFDTIDGKFSAMEKERQIAAFQLNQRKEAMGMGLEDKFKVSMKKPKGKMICDQCLTVIDKNGFQKQVETGLELQKNHDGLSKKLIKLEKEKMKVYDTLKDASDKLKGHENDLLILKIDNQNSKKAKKEFTGIVADIREKLKLYKKNSLNHLNELKKEMKKLEKSIAKRGDLDLDELPELQGNVDKWRDKIDSLESKLKGIQEKIKIHDENATVMEQIDDNYKRLKKERDTCEYCVSNLPKMKVFMIGSILPDINEELSNNLKSMDFDFSVSFKIGRELKNKSIKDELDMEIVNLTTGYQRVWKQLSGGEQQRISVATYLALNTLSKFNMIFMDEVLRNMDDTGRSSTLKLLEEKSMSGRKIFVIDHLKDIETQFEQSILVKNINGVSTIEY